MTTRTIGFIATLLLCGAASAADDAEAVYRKVHAAAVAGNLEEMRTYATETQRAAMALPDVPKTYKVTGKAVRRDGNAVELRASGTADSVGLGYTQMFGVIDLVREKGEWRVERLSWSTQRPGEYPQGYAIVQGPAPEPLPSAESQVPRFKPPVFPPEPSRLVSPKRPSEVSEPGITIQRSPPTCVIKPVMTDDDLRACGAHITD